MERLNRQKHLSLTQRAAIVGQHIGGLSNGHIARSMNVSVCFTVNLGNFNKMTRK